MLMGLCGELCSLIICFSLAVFETDVGGVVVAECHDVLDHGG